MANKFLIVCGGSGKGLLGQRRITGVDGEVQIDVREELISNPDNDPRLAQIAIDEPVQAVNKVLEHLRWKANNGMYDAPSCKAHAQFLADYYVGDVGLVNGLAQSPTIGGAVVQHPDNVSSIQNIFARLTTEWVTNVGRKNPIQVWIVSSTAGGTGEGTHRFVAETLVQVLKTAPNPFVELNFVRIGTSTYKWGWDRTSLNTFFGVAADAAFAMRLGRDYPGVALGTNWYYLDLPDVGFGDDAKPIRSHLVEMTVKAIMMDELTKPFSLLLVNNNTVIIRAGFWSHDFSEKAMYLETLNSLIEKLHNLIQPPYDLKFTADGLPEPKFVPGDMFQQALRQLNNKSVIDNRMSQGNWSFPRLERAKVPTTLGQLQSLIDNVWLSNIADLMGLPGQNLDGLKPKPEYQVEEVFWDNRGAEQRKIVPFDVANQIAADGSRFVAINDAHRARAWCIKLLGLRGPNDWLPGGLVANLLRLAGECSNAQYRIDPFADTGKRAESLSQSLADFVETLVKTNYLLQLYTKAGQLLQTQLGGARRVLDYAIPQREAAEMAVDRGEASPVIAADLSTRLDRLEGKDWLHLLEKAVERTNEARFKKEVIRGAVGLTSAGLKTVLGLDVSSDVEDIRSALAGRMGRMFDLNGNPFEALWWNGSAPTAWRHRHNYRILPQLEDGLQAQLGDGDATGVQYLYAGLGVLGLSVMAFEAHSIASQGDSISTPKYLLEPFVPYLHEVLQNWPKVHKVGEVDGQYRIATAGVIGDTLYKDALLKAGLTSEELDKIGEYYVFLE